MQKERVKEAPMDKMKVFFAITLGLLLLGGPASTVCGQKAADDILAGLTTAHVRVSYSEDGLLRESGQERNQLAADMERQLADTGLKLVSREEFERLLSSRGYPIGLLDLEVRVSKISGMDIRIFFVSLKLQQLSYVARKPVLRFLAPTWDATNAGTADDFNAVKKTANEVIGRFVADYKAENPK
jgi:hypothetical protein